MPGSELARLRELLPAIAGDALAQLRAGWRSQVLTLLGIVWGACAVVLLLSLGSGFNDFLDLSFEKTGSRWLIADPEYTSSEMGGRRPGRAVTLRLEDLPRIRAGMPSARHVAAQALEMVSVETTLRTRATAVSAADAPLHAIENHRIARGRWFDAADQRARRHVAVLGARTAELFFGAADPLGRRVQVAGVPFEVIGVAARKGKTLVTFLDLHDNMIFLPLEVGLAALGRGDRFELLLIEPFRVQDEARVRRELMAAIAPFHHLDPRDPDAISFTSIPEITAPSRNILFALQVLLGVVGSVTLAMAGMGVANLMVAVANERRRELAVRRTCGARRSDLTLQLLVETLVVVLAGGAIGAGAGLGVVALLNAVPLPQDFPPPRFLPSVVVTTFLVLGAGGLGAGLAPARLAARVDPAGALRVT